MKAWLQPDNSLLSCHSVNEKGEEGGDCAGIFHAVKAFVSLLSMFMCFAVH